MTTLLKKYYSKNIMLVGNYIDIIKIINTKIDNIYVFKCCLIKDIDNHNKKFLKREIKIPIFTEQEDIKLS